MSQNRVSEIIGNANFGNIDTLLSQGHDMEYIASFDPPYYIKKEKAYREKATGETIRIAFLNADWRDFESTAALKEKPRQIQSQYLTTTGNFTRFMGIMYFIGTIKHDDKGLSYQNRPRRELVLQ